MHVADSCPPPGMRARRMRWQGVERSWPIRVPCRRAVRSAYNLRVTSDATFTSRPSPRARRYLLVGIAVSLAVHALVLSLHFRGPPAAASVRDTGLEVVLLNMHAASPPAHGLVRAQADLDGGGDDAEGLARSPLPAAPDAGVQLEPGREQDHLRELEARQRAWLTTLDETAAKLAEARAAAEPNRPPADTAALAELAQQYAAIAARVEDYQRQPRRHYFAPSASAWPYAEYVEAWRERVEAVGNRFYPNAARGRLYGSLRLTVFVRADGSVEGTALDASSGHAILDNAAQDIIRRAAPFPPFPDAVRRDTDVMAITRTWHFQNDAFTTETP